MEKKEILGSFPLHGTLSSSLLPFTFHSRQRKFLQWRDLLFSVDRGVRAPSSFYDDFTHENLPSLATLLHCSPEPSLLFSFYLSFTPLSPNPPERIIVRVPYSFATISQSSIKKKELHSAIGNSDFPLSSYKIISFSKIFFSFLSTSFM